MTLKFSKKKIKTSPLKCLSVNFNNKPNILLILGDQHRWDCLASQGNREIQTPVLDSLANEGIRYENCFRFLRYL